MVVAPDHAAFGIDVLRLEDNKRICVDGSNECGSKEITRMEGPSIEPRNYNKIPNPVEMKIIRFFDYREDDRTSLSQSTQE